MKKGLIIGERGFIGKNLHKFLKHKHKVKLMRFKDAISYKLINEYDYVINTSINKDYIAKKYNKNFDNDLKLADKLNNKKTIFIFLSSRKVYKAKPNIKETGKLSPKSNYSKNKLITEKLLKKRLGGNLIILRISNIIGEKFKFSKNLHKTFIDIFYEKAKKGLIYNNKNNYKDFISIQKFCEIVNIIIRKNLKGTFNVSIGKKIYLNDLVSWLNYYNKRKIKIINNIKLSDGSFYLNNKKLMSKIKITNTIGNLKKDCLNLSKKLFK
ncbi:MAG: NAD-dependent epimerase/dehydratase family protein [Candidatus Pelagibacter sp.]